MLMHRTVLLHVVHRVRRAVRPTVTCRVIAGAQVAAVIAVVATLGVAPVDVIVRAVVGNSVSVFVKYT